MDGATLNLFEREHQRIDALLQAHLLDVVGGDFKSARRRLARWRLALARHIEIEQTHLLPHLPEGARWGARVYRLEHERITLLADEYAERVQAATAHAPQGRQARRHAVLNLLDAAHALRHLLEHHHRREEMALAQELLAALQAKAWAPG